LTPLYIEVFYHLRLHLNNLVNFWLYILYFWLFLRGVRKISWIIWDTICFKRGEWKFGDLEDWGI